MTRALAPLAALALLCGSTHGAAAESQIDSIGIGEAPVVRGNAVTARRRALTAARLDAVRKAADATGLLAALAPERSNDVTKKLAVRAARYVHAYRIQSDELKAGRIHLRVAFVLRRTRLARDLRAWVGGSHSPVAAAAARPAVKLTITGGIPAAQARLRRALASLGFFVPPANDSSSTGSRAPSSSRIGIAASLRVRDSEGIRGLELRTANAEVTLAARIVDGEQLFRETARGDAADRSSDAARKNALDRAIDDAARRVAGRLADLWPQGTAPDGHRLVHISAALARYAELGGTCARITAAVPEVSSCRVRRVRRGDLWLMVRTSLPTAALSAKLIAHVTLGGRALRAKTQCPGSVWLVAVAEG